jgi:peroxiredoxin
LDAFYRENAAKGWQVLGVAIDRVEAVQVFLRKTSVTFPVAMAGLGGTELGRSFGNQAGGLPFTVVLGADGTVAHRKMGQITHQDLAAWAAAGSA